MSKGFETAKQNFLTTLVEKKAGKMDLSATPLLGVDISTEGNGFDNLQRFSEHLPDGFESINGAALVGDEGQVSGNFMPHYAMLEERLNGLCGPAFREDVLPDGRIIMQWKLPEFGDTIDRQTHSAFYGATKNAMELLYGKIQQLTIECARSGAVGGNITLHYNYVRRAILMPTMFPENAGFRVVGENVAGSLTLGVKVPDEDEQEVILLEADGEGVIKGKLEALDGIETVTVTGRLVNNTGERHVIAPAVGAVAANFYGDVLIAPADAAADVEADIKTHFAALDNEADIEVTKDADGRFIVQFPYIIGGVPDEVGIAPNWFTGANPQKVGFSQLVVDVVAPEHQRITFRMVAGDSDYEVEQTRAGGDGSGPIALDSPYIEPTHVLCYKAETLNDLRSIRMGIGVEELGTGPDYRDPHIITSAQANSISFENMVNPAYTEDRQDSPSNHVDGDKTVSATITLPKDKDGRCEEIYATEKDKDGGCGAVPWWYRQAYKCGQWESWWDLYCVRNAKPNFPTENNIAQRQFALRRHYHPAGSFVATLIKPRPEA
jgi:hypothetical protein